MKRKFPTLQPWISRIFSSIKRDLRMEHLAKAPHFYKMHFGNRPLNRLTNEEIFAAYTKELAAGGNEDLEEWIVNRWVFHHGEIYQYFSSALSSIHADFSEIKSLDEAQSRPIVKGAIQSFGIIDTYLFSVLNEVVFPEIIFKELRQQAEKEKEAVTPKEETLEEIKSRYEQDINRLQKKCEDKILGAMKKYTTDVDALKKQIRALQKQLSQK